MIAKVQASKVLFVGVPHDSLLPGCFDTLGWLWEAQSLESWLLAPQEISDVAFVDMGPATAETWLRLHHFVPRLHYPLVLIVDGPVPSSFHYSRAGGLRVALVPPSASPDLVRSTANLVRQVHRSVKTMDSAAEDEFGRTELREVLRRLQSELDALRQLLDPPEASEPVQIRLGGREQEVCDLLMKGLAPGAIADGLGIAESTVKKHIHAIYRKRGVSNRAQLMAQR